MLVLMRRPGQTIRIADDITITVLDVKGNQVRIGINAPKNVIILREELDERMRRALAGEDVNGKVQDPPPATGDGELEARIGVNRLADILTD